MSASVATISSCGRLSLTVSIVYHLVRNAEIMMLIVICTKLGFCIGVCMVSVCVILEKILPSELNCT